MSQAPTHHLIKKYSNRKLYDTNTRRYITLDDIGQLVRDGGEVTVVNRDTGEDLTPVVLSQIVTRAERRGEGREAGVAGSGLERGHALLTYLRRTLSVPAEIVTVGVEKRRGDLEGLIENAIRQALAQLNMPSRGDVARLTARVEALEARVVPAARRGRRPVAVSSSRSSRIRRGAA